MSLPKFFATIPEGMTVLAMLEWGELLLVLTDQGTILLFDRDGVQYDAGPPSSPASVDVGESQR